MDLALSFIVAVAAGVVCHYIIKWLDGDKLTATSLGSYSEKLQKKALQSLPL